MDKQFKKDTTVRAKIPIWNKCGTRLEAGETAKIRSIFPPDAQEPPIVDLILKDGKLLIDIVSPSKCLEIIAN